MLQEHWNPKFKIIRDAFRKTTFLAVKVFTIYTEIQNMFLREFVCHAKGHFSIA